MNLNVLSKKSLATLAAVCLIALPAAAVTPAQTPALPAAVKSRIESLKTELNLSPAQQLQFAKAVAKTQQVVPQIQANHKALLAATKSELEKDVPDLAALAVQKDNTELANLALRQSARAEWLSLYATLTPEQIAVVKTHIEEVLGKLEAIRQLFSSHSIASSL